MTNNLNENTVHSNCFTTLKDTSKDGATILQEHFLLASRRGVSDLWDIYDVKVTTVPEVEHEPVYHFTALKSDAELISVFNKLAAFDKHNEMQGFLVNDDFTYPNALPYKEAATKHGIIQDVDTGEYQFIINAAVPQTSGSFKASDLENVTAAIAKSYEEATAETRTSTLIDQILKPHLPSNINLDKILGAVKFNKKINTLFYALDACNKYLQEIIEQGGSTTKKEGFMQRNLSVAPEFDVIRKLSEYSSYDRLHIDESFDNAFKALKMQIKELDLEDHPEFAAYLGDLALSVEMTYAIIMAQFEVKSEFSPHARLDEAAIKKRFSDFQKQFRKRLSTEQLSAAERTFLDYGNIKVPSSLKKAARTLNAIAQESRTQTNRYLKNIANDADAVPPSSEILPRSSPFI
jgi:hypothetical protein